MKINTKFNIGDHVWIIKEYKGMVCLYDDIIDYLYIDENGISYFMKEADVESNDADIVLYKDYTNLADKIYSLMKQIRLKETEIPDRNLDRYENS